MLFFCQKLESIMKDLWSRFVMSSVISGVTSPSEWATLDISKTENLVSPDKVDIGFASKGTVDEAKKPIDISQLQKYEFYQECITFLSKIVEKLKVKCRVFKIIIFINCTCLNLCLLNFYSSFSQSAKVIRAVFIAHILHSRWQTCFHSGNSNSLKQLDSRCLLTLVLTYKSHNWEMMGDPYLTEGIILQELPYLTLLMAFPGD